MTSTRSLRQRRKEETRLELARIAVRLFREGGCQATTVEDIVAAAGCSRSTFFRYFKTKEDVVFGDIPETYGKLLEALDERRFDEPPWKAALDALAESTRQYLLYANGPDPELARACIELWFSDPDLHRRYVEISSWWTDAIANFLAERRGVDVHADAYSQTFGEAIAAAGRSALRAQLVDPNVAASAMYDSFEMLIGGLATTDPYPRGAGSSPGGRTPCQPSPRQS